MEKPILTCYFFAYNHESFIAKGIESALCQNTIYQYTIVVVDDCSTDKTPDIVKEYESKYPGRVKLRRTDTNHGLNWQFEHAILDTDTKYFTLTGGDDYWISKDKIQKQIDYLETNKDVSAVLTGRVSIRECTGEVISNSSSWSWDMPADRLERMCSIFLNRPKSGYPAFTTACIHTDIVKKCLIEHPEVIRTKLPGEGTALVTAIAMYGEKMVSIIDKTVAYLVRENSLSHHKDLIKQLNYEFGYTELRYKLMENFGLDKERLTVYTKELIAVDIMNSIRMGLYQHLGSLIEHSSMHEYGKEICIKEHKKKIKYSIFMFFNRVKNFAIAHLLKK